MKRNKQITAIKRLYAAVIVLVGLSGSLCLAGMYDDLDDYGNSLREGTLAWDLAESEIVAYDGWRDPKLTISWSITRDIIGGVEVGPWHYSYTFTSPTASGDLSHLILAVSSDFSLTNPLDFINTEGYTAEQLELKLHLGSGDGKPNPFMPGSIYGIKFQDMFGEGTTSWTVAFDSYRNPMWGDFYAVDGAGDATHPWAAAYNSGFGELEGAMIAIADTSYVPVPGAVLLGILGLGAVGLKLRKFA